jgi:hypothetical protein
MQDSKTSFDTNKGVTNNLQHNFSTNSLSSFLSILYFIYSIHLSIFFVENFPKLIPEMSVNLFIAKSSTSS